MTSLGRKATIALFCLRRLPAESLRTAGTRRGFICGDEEEDGGGPRLCEEEDEEEEER